MNANDFSIDIGSIILKNTGISRDRTEYFRRLIESELGYLLNRDGIPDIATSGKISNIKVPELSLNEGQSDRHLARAIAQRIAKSMQRVEE